MAQITLELDLPDGIEATGYERHGDGHGIEVKWPLPERCRCQRCDREDASHIEHRSSPQVIRDLPLWEQPGFFVYQSPFHRCDFCGHRQDLIPPFKRKDVKYTYRFEGYVMRMLIGSNEEEVARRLGISAETVEKIVQNQLADAKPIDPNLKITDVGLDELSLKKRHKLYATLLTDLSDPERPRILAVAKGKDQAAGEACLNRLSEEQRAAVQTHRVDMGPAYPAACANLLKNSRAVADRFHVAKRFNEEVDDLRKKNHERVQGEVEPRGAERVSGLDVGVSTEPGNLDGPRTPAVGETIPEDPPIADVAPVSPALQGNFRHGARAGDGGPLVAEVARRDGGIGVGLQFLLEDVRQLEGRDSELL